MPLSDHHGYADALVESREGIGGKACLITVHAEDIEDAHGGLQPPVGEGIMTHAEVEVMRIDRPAGSREIPEKLLRHDAAEVVEIGEGGLRRAREFLPARDGIEGDRHSPCTAESFMVRVSFPQKGREGIPPGTAGCVCE